MSRSLPAILGGEPVFPEGPPRWPCRDDDVVLAVSEALADGSWGQYVATHVDAFCVEFGEMHQARHVRCCASGTAGVELALRGVGVGPGDEVIMAGYDFVANFRNIVALGGTPVLVDIEARTGQIDLEQIERARSERTRAVLVSHLHGGVVDMPRVSAMALRYGWTVIEDACQMPGAMVYGRRAGTWGDVGVVSFGGSKLLTAGRGGAVFTNRDDVAQRVKLYVDRGNDLSPMSEIQAVLLRPQLLKLDMRRRLRNGRVSELSRALGGMDGLVTWEGCGKESEPDFYKVAVYVDEGEFGRLSREQLVAALRAEGIAVGVGFPGLGEIHSRKRFRAVGDLAHSKRMGERLMVLHHPILLENEAEVLKIAAAWERLRPFIGRLAEKRVSL